MANLTGKSIIGFQPGGEGDPAVFGINPATGESLQPGYAAVSEAELNRAVELAADAFEVFGKTSGTEKAAFLRKIADNIEAIGDDLARLAPQETGLPEGRIRMETGRTCGQLRLFASVAELVKTTVSGAAPRSRATCARAASTAERARVPAQ